MKYIDSFKLADKNSEESFILNFDSPRSSMTCYSDNPYPFKIFPDKGLENIYFDELTIFYGSNGSGKSTLLNIISEKLGIDKASPFNKTPYYEDYLKLCGYKLSYGRRLPGSSMCLRSDDVFDYLIDIRSVNDHVDAERERLFLEYSDCKYNSFKLSSLDEYEELKKRNRAKSRTMSRYVSEKLPDNIRTKSNGETAFAIFTGKINENALYLLDEPENSLSFMLQQELASFIEDSIRFYGCQFIIATHSPFLLSMKGAKIYDLDSFPVSVRKWYELENVRACYDFFMKRKDEFN